MKTELELKQDQLEQLVDRYGLPRILAALSEVCALKAEHVETNWQDKQLSQAWTRIGHKLGALAHNTPRL